MSFGRNHAAARWRHVPKALLATGVFALLTAGSLWPVGGRIIPSSTTEIQGEAATKALASYSSESPEHPVHLLFLHHSVGEHLLSDVGLEDGARHVHPNGGDLRKTLEANHYRVHDATYGSKLGEHTDLFDWLPKFRDHMPEILRVARQDQVLPDGEVNRVVLFKSCFPNNHFESMGIEPGDPNGPALTVANAKATLRALLPIFHGHPDTLFVYLTAPPLLGIADDEPAIKWMAKKLLGKPTKSEKLARQGRLSRTFNDWVAAADGWLKDYSIPNVVVFHYYDVLTDHGASNFLRYPSGGGRNNHPNADGNHKATLALLPLLNRAVRRAGLGPSATQ